MKKLNRILFHRSVLVGVALLAQIVTLVLMVTSFSEHVAFFYWSCIALSILAALAIMSSRSEPGYKIVWLLLVVIFPVFGGVFYLLMGGCRVPKRTARRLEDIGRKFALALREDFKADDLLVLGEDAAGQARYLENYAACPAYTNTETEYFALGDLAMPRILEDLERAKRYIFLEYFICLLYTSDAADD